MLIYQRSKTTKKEKKKTKKGYIAASVDLGKGDDSRKNEKELSKRNGVKRSETYGAVLNEKKYTTRSLSL